MFNFSYNKETGSIDIISENNNFSLLFVDSPVDPTVGVTDTAISFLAYETIRVTIFRQNNNLELILFAEKPDEAPKSFDIQFNNINKLSIEESSCLIYLDQKNVILEGFDTIFGAGEDNRLSVNMSQDEIRLTLSEQDVNETMVVTKMTVSDTAPWLVTPGESMPEFAINFVDGDESAHARPLYKGVPVLSTSPAIEITSKPTKAGNDFSGDYYIFNNGDIKETRTVYLFINSNVVLEPYADATVTSEFVKVRMTKLHSQITPVTYSTQLINHKLYSCSIPISASWESGLILFEVIIPLRIIDCLPLAFTTSFDQTGDTNIPAIPVNIFSQNITANDIITPKTSSATKKTRKKRKKKE